VGEKKNSLPDVVFTLFKTAKDIANYNFILLNNLRKRFKEWSSTQKIGDLMVAMSHYFKIYKTYAEQYESVLEVVDLYQNKKPDQAFINILNNGKSHPLSQTQAVNSLLILPVQRVPRYVLLLTDLLKNTDDNHTDYTDTKNALESISSVAEEIDRAIGKAKSSVKCLQIQLMIESQFGKKSLLLPTLLEPHRNFY